MIRSPEYYYNAYGVDDWPDYKRALGKLVVNINAAALASAERIGASYDEVTSTMTPILQRSIESYMPVTAPRPELWASDDPEALFSDEPVLTASSTLVLDTSEELIRENTLLVPPIDHDAEELGTHRGIGLFIFSELMYQLTGSSMGRKDDYVWLGSKIDMEQVMLEGHIARKGPQLDTEIGSMLFAKTEDGFRLHPQLKQVMQTLYNKKWDSASSQTYAIDSEARTYVDKLLYTMYDDMGIRDGWYGDLQSMLKHGDTSLLPDSFHLGAFEAALVKSLDEALPTPKASEAMILEIDPVKVYKAIPFYIFPLTSRPPHTMMPAPCVPLDSLRAVYTESEIIAPKWLKVPHKRFSDLSDHQILADQTGVPVTLSEARKRGGNPEEPLCILRYNTHPATEWGDCIGAGKTAPWWHDIDQPQLSTPRTAAEMALASLVMSRVRESPRILERAVEHSGGSQDHAIQSLLGSAGLFMTIPSVRSVKELEGLMRYTR
jgi:hypothetical protein